MTEECPRSPRMASESVQQAIESAVSRARADGWTWGRIWSAFEALVEGEDGGPQRSQILWPTFLEAVVGIDSCEQNLSTPRTTRHLGPVR